MRPSRSWYVRAARHSGVRAIDFPGGIARTMQLGFNTNFRYRGVLFHVQTEDSGTGNPHVITHLFHGGNIMSSVKQEYSDLLGEPDFEGAVRKLMESMHKNMLHQLSRGEHDEVILSRLGDDIFVAATDRAPEPPTVTEEELPAAPIGETVLQPSDIDPLPSSAATTANAPTSTLPPASPATRPAAAPTPRRSPAPAPAASASPGPTPTPSPPASPSSASPSTPPAAAAAAAATANSRLSKVFGDRVVSEKPLDEVVLDYLVENARKRKRQPK
ncbi:MAG: hypothetical protein AB8G23_21285 [Myxococcota bacterium]